jgi:hypothetical protein
MGWKERPEEFFKLRLKIFDMLNTWITNVIVLEYWLEKKEGAGK